MATKRLTFTVELEIDHARWADFDSTLYGDLQLKSEPTPHEIAAWLTPTRLLQRLVRGRVGGRGRPSHRRGSR
jgi:hypothetical protein